jgi:hypothetical protein
MTIESLGRKGGPKPGDLGATPRHSRRPQPETRVVPSARPKPAPPRTPPGMGEARLAIPQPPTPRPQGSQGPQGTGTTGTQGQQGPQAQRNQQGPIQGRGPGPGAVPGSPAQAQTQSRVGEGRPARPPEAQPARTQGPGQGPTQKPRGRGDGKTENRGERSLYDGGSPSANRLGPAKAMRARDVSRPRDW